MNYYLLPSPSAAADIADRIESQSTTVSSAAVRKGRLVRESHTASAEEQHEIADLVRAAASRSRYIGFSTPAGFEWSGTRTLEEWVVLWSAPGAVISDDHDRVISPAEMLTIVMI
jgi:hypothetical protein